MSSSNADPVLARLPARGHRLEHLHARRRAGVGRVPGTTWSCSARTRRPSASTSPARRSSALSWTRGCRPSWSTGTRGWSRCCSRTCHPGRARALCRAERGSAPRAPPGRPRLRQPRPDGRAGGSGERCPFRRQGPRLGARILDAGQSRALGVGRDLAQRGGSRLRRLRTHPWGAPRRGRRRRARSRGTAGRGRRAVRRPSRRQTPSRGCWRNAAPTRRTRATGRNACRTRGTSDGCASSSPGTRRPSSTSASSSTTRASTCSWRRCGAWTRGRSSSGSATTAASWSGRPRLGRCSPARSSIATSSN